MNSLLARISINWRLWALFGFAMMVLGLVTGIGVWSMERANAETLKSLALADEVSRAVDQTRLAQVHFRKQVKEWKDLLLRGSEKGFFDGYWKRFADEEAFVGKTFIEINGHFQKLGLDTAPVAAAKKATEELGIKARTAVALYDQSKPESAFAVDKQARGLDHVASNAIDELVAAIEKKKDEQSAAIVAQNKAQYREALELLATGGTALTLALALLAIAIIRSITTPLTRTIAIFDSIRGGNLRTTVPPDRRHEIGALWNSLDAMQSQLRGNTEQLERNIVEIAALKDKSEKLLLNILPAAIAHRLKERQETIAEAYEVVTVLFADLVGFTAYSQTVTPTELVMVLNNIFVRFDGLASRYGIEKIKTIGDAYMACGGIPLASPDHARNIAEMALAMHEEMAAVSQEVGSPLQMRIGINTGPVVAGVIGVSKFIYDLWGDAVNTASRMESHGSPGAIHVSESTWRYLKDDYAFEDRGTIQVKGKGEMRTFFLLGRKE